MVTIGDTVSDLTDLGFEPQTFRTDNNVFTNHLNDSFNGVARVTILHFTLVLAQRRVLASFFVLLKTHQSRRWVLDNC